MPKSRFAKGAASGNGCRILVLEHGELSPCPKTQYIDFVNGICCIEINTNKSFTFQALHSINFLGWYSEETVPLEKTEASWHHLLVTTPGSNSVAG